jgi:hypothetical protein
MPWANGEASCSKKLIFVKGSCGCVASALGVPAMLAERVEEFAKLQRARRSAVSKAGSWAGWRVPALSRLGWVSLERTSEEEGGAAGGFLRNRARATGGTFSPRS